MKVKANTLNVASFEPNLSQSRSPLADDQANAHTRARLPPREPPSRLEPSPGWRVRRYPGFALHEDATASSVEDFAGAVAAGLSSEPKTLPSHLLYDAAGSALFDAITRQPEYYLTRTEENLLQAHVGTLCALTRCRTL